MQKASKMMIVIGVSLLSVGLNLINSFIVDAEKHLSMSSRSASCSRLFPQTICGGAAGFNSLLNVPRSGLAPAAET